jgi:hypothetical protein
MSAQPASVSETIGSLVTTAQLRDLAERLEDVVAYVAFLGQRDRAEEIRYAAVELLVLATEEEAIDAAQTEA